VAIFLLSSEQDKAGWIKVRTVYTESCYSLVWLNVFEGNMLLFLSQAFQRTIEIFQQKNESFKNALKDEEEVSVSVTSKLFTQKNPSTPFCAVTQYVFISWCRTQSWGSAPLAGSATMKWQCVWSVKSLSTLWRGGGTTAEPADTWVILMLLCIMQIVLEVDESKGEFTNRWKQHTPFPTWITFDQITQMLMTIVQFEWKTH